MLVRACIRTRVVARPPVVRASSACRAGGLVVRRLSCVVARLPSAVRLLCAVWKAACLASGLCVWAVSTPVCQPSVVPGDTQPPVVCRASGLCVRAVIDARLPGDSL